MTHLQQSTSSKQSAKHIIMLRPQQTVLKAALGCVEMLVGTLVSGWNLLDRGLAFVGLGFDCVDGLFNSLFVSGLSIDSSDYINRLEHTVYRSGERRRLAAIPL